MDLPWISVMFDGFGVEIFNVYRMWRGIHFFHAFGMVIFSICMDSARNSIIFCGFGGEIFDVCMDC